ncbi:hypothetical protein K2173_007270 [Erythroxylum novogranatense]|uniref:NAC domain-containing protein n=1 Tax=Erythroxylum novogranatense TaxID=1862640 RepID=A0AAV8T7C5_9ROSI|nr:hypothetical protein K2173_007270 [Erythroxylum novogranatense]
MCPPAAPPITETEFDCRDGKIFMSLRKLDRGSPPPDTVISDVNPFHYEPVNVPENIWLWNKTEGNGSTLLGRWKVKGEACKLFSNSILTGWKTTFEYFEGPVSDERKTNWLLEKYWITQKEVVENNKEKQASSLCRIYRGGKEITELGNQTGTSICTVTEGRTRLQHLVPQMNDNVTDKGSTSKREVVRNDETTNLALAQSLVNDVFEIPPEIDYLDYIEMEDFVNPVSRSSSSDNSSCLSSSSHEYFDPVELLRELEKGSNQNLAKDGGCKLSVTASVRPDELIMLPTSPETFIRVEENVPTKSETSIKGLDNKHSSSNLQEAGTSSGNNTEPREGKRLPSAKGKKKMPKKYLCFMPFGCLC